MFTSEMLKLGSSRPWQDALELLTGTRDMDVNVLREYFSPLEQWLIKDNAQHKEYIGWEKGEYNAQHQKYIGWEKGE